MWLGIGIPLTRHVYGYAGIRLRRRHHTHLGNLAYRITYRYYERRYRSGSF